MTFLVNYLVLGEAGLATARRLQAELGGVIHGYGKRVQGANIRPFDDVAATLRNCFAAGQPLIALCAAGIVIRHLAPVLSGKHDDAPVLALAEDGSAIVPLLGGIDISPVLLILLLYFVQNLLLHDLAPRMLG